MACLRTYCGLTILSTELDPEGVTTELGVQPTRSRAKDPFSPYRPRRERSFWTWSTEESVDSTDYRDHLQSILDLFADKEHALESLRGRGCVTRISCFLDAAGNTEIWLERPAIVALAKLGLEIWWDVYPASEEEQSGTGQPEG